MAEEADSEREILAMEEEQLELVLNTAGIVEDCELSMPYRTQLTSDKWNLFLLRVEEFKDKILSEFLKEGEEKDVKEGMEVNVYDTGGHEFEAILKKWESLLPQPWLAQLPGRQALGSKRFRFLARLSPCF